MENKENNHTKEHEATRKLQNNGGISIIINKPALEQAMPHLPDQINGMIDAFWEVVTRQVPHLTKKEWDFCLMAFGNFSFFDLVNNLDYSKDEAFLMFPEYKPLQEKILGFSHLELMRWAAELVEQRIHESNTKAKKLGKPLDYPYSYRIKRHTSYGAVDYKKGTAQLSRDLGVPMAIISRQRKKHAPETTQKNISWEDLDWSKTDAQIVAETGKAERTVKARRQRFAPEEHRPPLLRKHIDWSKVDWGKNNEELAEEFGCKVLTIAQKRYKCDPAYTTKSKKKDKKQ